MTFVPVQISVCTKPFPHPSHLWWTGKALVQCRRLIQNPPLRGTHT